MIRRINLSGGPGSGKSTTAAEVFAHLKKHGKSVEMVREYVKEWAYEGRDISDYDQLYFFGKQLRKEIVVLNSKVDVIVTDSPLILQIIYASKTNLSKETINAMVTILMEYDKKYPCLNIILDRGHKPYVQEGRYQTYGEAKQMDRYIELYHSGWKFDYVKIPFQDSEKIIKAIMEVFDERDEIGDRD